MDFDAASSSLAEGKIYIWPLSKGKLSGIEEREVYATLPLLTVDLTDIYPLASAKLASLTLIRVTHVSPTRANS